MSRLSDPVTPDTWRQVTTIDGGCVAPLIDPTVDPCRGRLTVDHVKDRPHVGDPIVKRKRRRAPSDLEHLATVCVHHHLDGWATSHRPDLRTYIAARNFSRANA